ncbi:MAG: SLC13 family permease [Candidatus Helarchaeota archaeon]
MIVSSILILCVLVAVIILVISGKINRLIISLSGAIITMIILLFDSVPFSTIIGFIFGTTENNFINFHSILLILGMLIIISVCQEVGVFSLIAFKVVQKTGGNRFILYLIMCLLAFIFSAILNNILTVLLLIPLTITICKILNVNPIPYIIAEAIVVNIGGILFIISSIPNILISQSVGWTFDSFFIEVGVYSFFLLLITLILLGGIDKKKLEKPDKKLVTILKEYNAWYFVKSKKSFYKAFFMLVLTIALFIILPTFFPINIDMIAISSGIILIIIEKINISSLIKVIDFELILYLLSIFLITDALEYTGLLIYLSDGLSIITQGNPIVSAVVILWLSAFLSSSIDNVPITKILIPIVNDLTLNLGYSEAQKNIIFSSLIYGANLGDNLLPNGDNILVMRIVENYDKKIKYKQFFKIGFITTIIQLIVITLIILMRISSNFIIIGFIILLIIFLVIFILYNGKNLINIIKKRIRFFYNHTKESKKKRIK